MNWTQIKYFKSKEFDSPGVPGSGNNMNMDFVVMLDILRGKMGRPFHINSGYRTVEHNAAVGGVESSAHTRGLAADIAMSDLQDCIRTAIVAARMGFKRIGVDLKGKYIHVDIDSSLPSPVTWFYS